MTRDPEAWARLGHALRTARNHRGLTQQDLAAEAGVSSRAVQVAEGGAVPKARMPYSIDKIAAALGWPEGAVEAVLDGAAPPDGGWQDVSVQRQLAEERVEGILTSAMVRAMSGTSAAEIRAATKIALDELRKQGFIAETHGVQPEPNHADS
ncbi:helix-turn-helix domain-containing protein [Streptomyces sp. NBC_01506]|uniref:helix-turn-helix domain-containing protein n=1 Tax=Streptomyces sp. NBC_01506 TaxID=2903887 RepID=UPI0038672164